MGAAGNRTQGAGPLLCGWGPCREVPLASPRRRQLPGGHRGILPVRSSPRPAEGRSSRCSFLGLQEPGRDAGGLGYRGPRGLGIREAPGPPLSPRAPPPGRREHRPPSLVSCGSEEAGDLRSALTREKRNLPERIQGQAPGGSQRCAHRVRRRVPSSLLIFHNSAGC